MPSTMLRENVVKEPILWAAAVKNQVKEKVKVFEPHTRFTEADFLAEAIIVAMICFEKLDGRAEKPVPLEDFEKQFHTDFHEVCISLVDAHSAFDRTRKAALPRSRISIRNETSLMEVALPKKKWKGIDSCGKAYEVTAGNVEFACHELKKRYPKMYDDIVQVQMVVDDNVDE